MSALPRTRRRVSRTLALTNEVVVDYLVRSGLIPRAGAAHGTFEIRDLSRRNHVFAAIRDHGDSFLLKQGIGQDRIATIQQEARAYEMLPRDTRDLAGYLPQCYRYDPLEHVLVLQFFKDGQDLRKYCAQNHRFPVSAAEELGRALGALHRKTTRRSSPLLRTPHFRRLPWMLPETIPEATILWTSSAGEIQLLEILQKFGQFRMYFDRLRREWKAESFIHFDLRWDNCILIPHINGSRRQIELKIVDWELAQMGDPRWDVGAIFSNFLSFWVSGIPITGDCPPDRYLQAAEMPLERLQPAIRTFWTSYKHEMGISEGTSSEAWLLRAVEYGASQLVQAALEYMRDAPAPTGLALCLLQLCLNILRQPRRATAELLGIST